MEKERHHMTERILNHTLEIIYLLTGEGYTIMNKSGGLVAPGEGTCVLGGWNECKSPTTVPSPNSLTYKGSNDLKILELTKKIIQLLTREVPIRCQDVAVYFSMEEQEYIEGHRDHYKDVLKDNLPSVDSLNKENTPERSPRRLYINNYRWEDSYGAEEYQEEDLIDVKVIDPVEEQTYVMEDQDCQEEKFSAHMSSVENNTKNTLEEHFFSSLDHKIENSNFQDNYFGIHSVTVNVPLPGADTSPDYCNHGGCFADERDVVTHSGSYRADLIYSCSECDKCFNKNEDFIRHQRTHKGEKLLPCSQCGKSFTHRSNLLKHLRIHIGDKPFSCSDCGKCFKRNSILREHQRIHTGEKPFPCFDCGKRFTQRSALATHQRIHTGEKPFLCSFCGKSFTKKSTLVDHQRIHTGEKPFPCSECGKCFAQRSTLMEHQKIHLCEKLFVCSECGKCFTQKSYLVKHQRIHTG